MFNFLSIRKSNEAVIEKHKSLVAEYDKVNTEGAAVRSARTNRNDIYESVERWVASQTEKFSSGVAAQFTGDRYSNGSIPPYQAGFFGALGGTPEGSMVPNMDACMCVLFGEEIKRSIVKVIADMPWPNEGLPQAERAAKIAKLHARSNELLAEIKELAESAAEAGIDL